MNSFQGETLGHYLWKLICIKLKPYRLATSRRVLLYDIMYILLIHRPLLLNIYRNKAKDIYKWIVLLKTKSNVTKYPYSSKIIIKAICLDINFISYDFTGVQKSYLLYCGRGAPLWLIFLSKPSQSVIPSWK